MNINQNIKLHNKWEVTVCDAISGEVKQEAIGYNVITNAYFKMRFGLLSGIASTSALGHIYVGTGSGTPAITDTALFNRLLLRESTLLETHYEYPTSYIVKQIKLNADEYNGYTLTEVGLAHYYHPNWGSDDDVLCTHAMLQDAEGNQIAIAKTDTDVVYIRATFYCTFTQEGWGDNGVYPEAAKNTLIQWLLLGTDSMIVRTHRFPIEHSSDLDGDYLFTKTYRINNGSGNLETMTFNLPEITILDTEFSPHIVKNIGISGFGAFQFPDASVFPDYAVTRLVLGDGDGETTAFNIKCPLIKPGSVHIYVGDLEKTAGRDYSVDLESNCNNTRENYYTASLKATGANVLVGDMNTRSASSDYVYHDPFYWGIYPVTEKRYPSGCYVTQASPIWIDLGTAKECNRLRIDNRTMNANNLIIEYSNDNENWTAVSYEVETPTYVSSYGLYTWKFASTSARYWRCYIPNYNWYLSLFKSNELGTRDGASNIGAFIFLGKVAPGLVFTTPPAAGETVEASYLLNVPYKTQNNLIRIACSVTLQRG